MSSNFPPGGESGQPPPPPLPGWGEPQRDYLVGGAGAPGEKPERSIGRRIATIGGGIGILALVGGGVWAWNFWFSQGPQPSEALPASTLAYVSIDLDPSGEQKVEAVRTLKKFPVFEEELGFDLDTDDDVKKWLFETIQDEEDACPDLDYDDDLEPWLGDRFAIAVVDRGEDDPAPVVVAQVTDEDQAADGLESLLDCASTAGPDEELAGYAVDGEWAILAESEEIATEVLEAGQDDPLSDDADYQKWTEAVGDPGVVNLYAAPEAGEALLDFADGMLGGFLFGYSGQSCSAVEFPEQMTESEFEDFEEYSGDYEPYCEELEPEPSELPDGVRQFFEEFSGAAGTVRFDGGDVEIEFATGESEFSNSAILEAGGTDVLTTLPDSTAAAVGAGLREGWLDIMLDQIEFLVGDSMSRDEALAEFEAETGLSREDLEALDGASFAIAFDSDVDSSAFEDEDITRVPLGAKIEGDTEAIEAALSKLKDAAGDDLAQLVWRTEGDYVLVSGSPAYLDVLAEEGDLGDDDAFEDLAPDADGALGVLFVNFDAGGWLDEVLVASGAPDDVQENVEPLQGLGISLWMEDGEEHTLFKLTTE